MAAVERHHGIVTFVTKPRAEEYRKSSAMRADEQPRPSPPVEPDAGI